MTEKWNLIIDVAKCNGCYNCFVAVKDEYVGNSEVDYFAPQPPDGHAWLRVTHHERSAGTFTDVTYVPRMCNHCDDAPCISAAIDGGARKRADGIVIIDPTKAKGQRAIADACPYGAIFWNDREDLPQAWPFDAHLIDRGWKMPRCVQSCATGAMEAVKIDDHMMQQRAVDERLTPLHPEYGTRPRLYYKNIDRIRTCFIAGTVEIAIDGVAECAVEAEVALIQSGNVVAQTVTDAFGDFKIDGLTPDKLNYEIAITYQDRRRNIRVQLINSLTVGRIAL